MDLAFLKLLVEEDVVSLSKLQKQPRKYLQGIVRIVDDGASLGVFIDTKTADMLLEDLEARSSEFAEKIKSSRRSGKVTLETIEKDLAQDTDNKE